MTIKIQESNVHPNHTEYNINYSKANQRKLSVPNDKKDEFVKEYKRFHDKNSIVGVLLAITGAGVGAVLGSKFITKISKEPVSSLKKYAAGTISAIISAFTTMAIAAITTNSLDCKLRSRYDAKIVPQEENKQES